MARSPKSSRKILRMTFVDMVEDFRDNVVAESIEELLDVLYDYLEGKDVDELIVIVR
jgi:hypothetical protein